MSQSHAMRTGNELRSREDISQVRSRHNFQSKLRNFRLSKSRSTCWVEKAHFLWKIVHQIRITTNAYALHRSKQEISLRLTVSIPHGHGLAIISLYVLFLTSSWREEVRHFYLYRAVQPDFFLDVHECLVVLGCGYWIRSEWRPNHDKVSGGVNRFHLLFP